MGVPQDNIVRTDLVGDITLSVRADESGEFKLFYGDKQTAPPEVSDPPVKVLVYLKIGGIKITWALVAWSSYAALVILAAVHVACFGNGRGGSPDSGATSRGKQGRRR